MADWDGADGLHDDGPITEAVENRPGELRYAESEHPWVENGVVVDNPYKRRDSIMEKVASGRQITWDDIYPRKSQ